MPRDTASNAAPFGLLRKDAPDWQTGVCRSNEDVREPVVLLPPTSCDGHPCKRGAGLAAGLAPIRARTFIHLIDTTTLKVND